MPVLRALALIAYLLARLFNASIYRSIKTNIMLVHPDMPEHKRLALANESLKNQLISTVDSAKCWAMPPEWAIAQIKTVHNAHILKAGLQSPTGMLIIAPHVGTWEMMNAWVGTQGNLTIMYKPTGKVQIDNFVLQGRKKLNATLVPTDATGVKAIFKTLKDGGFSVLLPDHVPDRHGGVIAPFFGIPTMTGTLASKLAQKTHCKLVGLACIRRDDNDGFDVFCYDLANPSLYDKDPTVASSALNTAMEEMIYTHFSHYMWGYRRFKTTPFGENPYLLPFDELHALAKSYKHGITNTKDNQ